MFEPMSSPGAESQGAESRRAAPQNAAANYIVYVLDGAGRIRGAEWIAAVSDEHALSQVRALGSATECELWQRDRRIGRVAGSASGAVPGTGA